MVRAFPMSVPSLSWYDDHCHHVETGPKQGFLTVTRPELS